MKGWIVDYGFGSLEFGAAVLVIERGKLVDTGVEDEEKSNVCWKR